MSHVPIKHKERLKLKSTEICNVIDIMTARRSPFAAAVVRLRAPIVVKIRGKESRVVKIARESLKRRIA